MAKTERKTVGIQDTNADTLQGELEEILGSTLFGKKKRRSYEA